MKINEKKRKSILGHQIIDLYPKKISYFTRLGRFMKLKGDIEWVFFPRFECYNTEHLKAILNKCQEIEVRER